MFRIDLGFRSKLHIYDDIAFLHIFSHDDITFLMMILRFFTYFRKFTQNADPLRTKFDLDFQLHERQRKMREINNMGLHWLRPQKSLWDILGMEESQSESDFEESDSDSEAWSSGAVDMSDSSFELATAMRKLPYRRRRMLVFELLKVRNEKKNKRIEELKSEAYRHQMYFYFFLMDCELFVGV